MMGHEKTAAKLAGGAHGAAEWLNRACALCERYPVWTIVAALGIPELFLLIMGAMCKAVPPLLTASLAILVVCVILWAAGLSLWVCAMVRRCRGKHARTDRAEVRERGTR